MLPIQLVQVPIRERPRDQRFRLYGYLAYLGQEYRNSLPTFWLASVEPAYLTQVIDALYYAWGEGKVTDISSLKAANGGGVQYLTFRYDEGLGVYSSLAYTYAKAQALARRIKNG